MELGGPSVAKTDGSDRWFALLGGILVEVLSCCRFVFAFSGGRTAKEFRCRISLRIALRAEL